jgi:hypothetical protein
LLFYSDFVHYKNYSVSITGARYTRLSNGLAPYLLEKFLTAIDIDNEGIKKEFQWNNECPVELYVSNTSLDSSIFTDSEIKVLAAIKECFHGYSPRKIFETVNKEKGFQETKDSDLIPYSYAEQISIDV